MIKSVVAKYTGKFRNSKFMAVYHRLIYPGGRAAVSNGSKRVLIISTDKRN